jgi:cellulase
MKYVLELFIAALAAKQVTAHSMFQELWVNGVDQICQSTFSSCCWFFPANFKHQSTCARVPASNSPITDPMSNNIRCNGRGGVVGKCTVVAGETVTVEMHAVCSSQITPRTCLLY